MQVNNVHSIHHARIPDLAATETMLGTTDTEHAQSDSSDYEATLEEDQGDEEEQAPPANYETRNQYIGRGGRYDGAEGDEVLDEQVKRKEGWTQSRLPVIMEEVM
jgi:hypothetical protein